MSLRSEVIRIYNELISGAKKISELPAAGALTGNELVEGVQGGANVKMTTQDIADLGGGGGSKMDKYITANRQTASYTLVLADDGKLVEMNVGSANDLTVPLNATVAFPVGTQILLSQYGAGQTTVVATGGVTIRSSGGKLKLTGQYSAATLVKIATDEWYLFGDIAA